MNIREAREKIQLVEKLMEKIGAIAGWVEPGMFDEEELGMSFLNRGDSMFEVQPGLAKELNQTWEELQKNVPPSFAIDGNLVRHISFGEAHDWLDISTRDIPRELTKINEYRTTLSLVEYMETLHPEVARVSETAMNGDIDAALKTVFATFDAKIRERLATRPDESTVNLIGQAFREGTFVAPQMANSDHVRSFLQGVAGHYRGMIVHNPLPAQRNRLEASLSLFCLAHEAFSLLDACIKHLP